MKHSAMLVLKVACAVVGCLGLASCSTFQQPAGSDFSLVEIDDTSNGVAATVNGSSIGESAVTGYVQDFRSAHGLTEEEAWANWMAENGMTPEAVRKDAIDFYVNALLVEEAAKQEGVSIDDEEVDNQIESAKEQFGNDAEWQDSLKSMGMNESRYRMSVETSLLQQKLKDRFASESDAEDDELVLEYANAYALAYDGSKRSSQILFKVADEATAESVLEQLRAGTLDFAAAAAQYSQDEASRDKSGDMGWDALVAVPNQDYSQALAQLEPGEISGLVVSDDGIRIIMCTDVYHAPDQVTSLDQMPQEFREAIKTSVLGTAKDEAYATWFNEFSANADVDVKEMPSGLPYDVEPMQTDNTVDEPQTGMGSVE